MIFSLTLRIKVNKTEMTRYCYRFFNWAFGRHSHSNAGVCRMQLQTEKKPNGPWFRAVWFGFGVKLEPRYQIKVIRPTRKTVLVTY